MSALMASLLVAAPGEVAVIALGDPRAMDDDLAATCAVLRQAGAMVPAPEDLVERLTGVREPRLPDEQALTQMLADAADREARFDTAGANALRGQVLRAFDAALRPSAGLRTLAARA